MDANEVHTEGEAIAQMEQVLDGLSTDARRRVLGWAEARYALDLHDLLSLISETAQRFEMDLDEIVRQAASEGKKATAKA